MLVSGTSAGPKNQEIPKIKKTLGREDFLLLLVTQLKHQDPLSPMSNEDFIAQTAQFTSLETLESIDNNIVESNQDSALTRSMFATSMIGKEVKLNTDKISLQEGKSTEIEFNIPKDSRAVVSIRDQDGKTIREENIKNVTGKHKYTWNGLDNEKDAVKDGVYSVSVNTSNAAGINIKVPTIAKGRVSGVKIAERVLIIGNLETPISDVLEVSE